MSLFQILKKYIGKLVRVFIHLLLFAGQDASSQAWVTLATNDSYALGALVLAASLRHSGTSRKIVIMVTPEGLSNPMKSQLNQAFDQVVDVSLLDSKDQVNLALLERPELGVTFTKLHCWCLVQYSKCVFLDADTMVRSISRGFQREKPLNSSLDRWSGTVMTSLTGPSSLLLQTLDGPTASILAFLCSAPAKRLSNGLWSMRRLTDRLMGETKDS